MPSNSVDREMPNGQVIPGRWRNEANLDSMRKDTQKNAKEYAKAVRISLANYFLSNEGQIPWQYEKAILGH